MPKPAGAAIGGDAAVIGNEVVVRIFRRDAALQGVAVEADRRPAAGMPVSGDRPMRAPSAMRICALTMSTPVTHLGHRCSTWMRGLTSMK